ncbi:MAG: YeeE/YedE thiosulfate transporter family protein [Methyloceanibacter sp.]
MIVPAEFTPVASLIGGVMIGVAAVMLMALDGRVAGISGILGRLLPPYEDADAADAAAFLLGLIAAPLVYALFAGGPFAQTVSDNAVLMGGAGLLVGFGAALGGGCTSGHGVCGLSRLSVRSMIATAVFMFTGFATMFVMRHVIGG